MPEGQDLESFVGTSFRSVWALEVLQFLAASPETCFSPEELIAALRVSEAVVAQSVQNLSAAGLAVVDGEGRVSFYASQQENLVHQAIEFYRRSPDKVRRLIVAQSAPGVTAFADAFRLRKD